MPDSTASAAPASAAPAFASFAPQQVPDPYPVYDRLRAAAPVQWSPAENAWVLSRYADVAAIMADPGFLVAEVGQIIRGLGQAAGRSFPDLCAVMDVVLFLRNPPGHGEMRRFFAAVLTGEPLSAQEPVLHDIARSLLDPARAGDGFDAVRDYADRLPPLFMGHLLGIPRRDIGVLIELASDITRAFDRGQSFRFYGRVDRNAAQARRYFRDAIAARRQVPRADGLSRMIALSERDFSLDDEELASRAFFLLLAGVETTAASIGLAIRTLVEHPEAFRRLRQNRALVAGAIEECLRYDSTVQQATRIATRDTVIGGHTIRAGQRVVLLIGAAHRDPDVYDAPSVFDIDRRGPPNLAFGKGPHHCLGASLARMELRVAVTQLLDLPMPVSMPQRDAPQWWPNRTARRLKTLPLTFEA